MTQPHFHKRLGYVTRLTVLALAGIAVVIGVSIAIWLWQVQKTPPNIDGTYLQPARDIQAFELIDHHDQTFTNRDLTGQWHFVSYGFTHCPDVCPMTLTKLARVQALIEEGGAYTDVTSLFYTVDPDRDTVAVLAEYVPYFNDDFVGLTPRLTKQKADTNRSFEQSLGIKVFIDPLEKRENSANYSVSHGIKLYLLNAQGKLQAVFEPDINAQGFREFSVDTLYNDYLAIRSHADR